MTIYYVYRKSCGHPLVLKDEENTYTGLIDDSVFLYETDEDPKLDGKKWNGTEFVDIPLPAEYKKNRAASYPKIADQMDMLWHAMDSGVLPVVESFYTSIKDIKEKYPKT